MRKGSILLTVATQVSCQVFLQVESFSTTCYLINRLPSLVLDGKTPDHEILYGKIPSYSLLPTFGCFLFPFLHDYIIICPINYHLDLFLVFLLDIVIRVFVAWIRKPTEFMCLAMFSFLRIISLMITPLFLL